MACGKKLKTMMQKASPVITYSKCLPKGNPISNLSAKVINPLITAMIATNAKSTISKKAFIETAMENFFGSREYNHLKRKKRTIPSVNAK
jgi:hypothetical protein